MAWLRYAVDMIYHVCNALNIRRIEYSQFNFEIEEYKISRKNFNHLLKFSLEKFLFDMLYKKKFEKFNLNNWLVTFSRNEIQICELSLK